MSDFLIDSEEINVPSLTSLGDRIFNELMDANFSGSEYIIKNVLDSLGENAKRMLEIGLMQDKLIQLGFEWSGNMQLEHSEYYEVMVEFSLYWVYLSDGSQYQTFTYDSPTWQNELLNEIKQHILSLCSLQQPST